MSYELMNAYNFLVPANGLTRVYKVVRTFDPLLTETIDFREIALDGLPFIPGGVIVDNSQANADLKIRVREMSFSLTIPAGAVAQLPYPAPKNQTVELTGDGLATVLFVDYPVIPFINGAPQGITEIVAGDGITVDATDPVKPVVTNSGIIEIVPGSNVTINLDDPQRPVISSTGGGGGGGGTLIAAGGIFTLIGLDMGTPYKLPVATQTYGIGALIDGDEFVVPAGVSVFELGGVLMAMSQDMATTVSYGLELLVNDASVGSPTIFPALGMQESAAYVLSAPVSEGDRVALKIQTVADSYGAAGAFAAKFY